MTRPTQRQGFTAHGGIRDIPRGAVPLQKEKSQEAKPARKSHVGLLMTVLVFSMALLVSQNSDQINAYVNKPIRVVQMANELQRADEGNIRSALAAHLNAGFFALDVQAIKAQLEADPWIEKAVITRTWPDTLSVAITEEIAIARWGDRHLLNQYGESFAPELRTDDLTLPLLQGPEGMERKVMEQYQVFSQMLSDTGLRVREIDLSDRGSWILHMDNDLRVSIGRSNVMERMERFVRFFSQHLYAQLEQIEAIDLRYSNGISIRNKTVMPAGVASK
ncbi:MAG: cell division protein FtsQ/DivIB [Gammaproteobacteria bacterium]